MKNKNILRTGRHPESMEATPGLKVNVVAIDVNLEAKAARDEYRLDLSARALELIEKGKSPFKEGDGFIAASGEGTVLIKRKGKNIRVRVD